MFVPPIFRKLQAESQRILLLGMGGGYDIYSGIPLYFELTGLEPPKHVFLANLSFTKNVERLPIGKRFTDICIEVKYTEYEAAGKGGDYEEKFGFPRNYFPEFHLSKWLYEEHGRDAPVYTFAQPLCNPAIMQTAVQQICDLHSIDTIVLIDAGVDSLLKGDEEGLGTYGEDLLSILAVRGVQRVPHKYLMCIGLSTEGGISEHDFLENWVGVQEKGGYLGCVGWQSEMPSVQEYSKALARCVPTNSTINAQINASIQGHYGHYLPPEIRSRVHFASDLWINPLMALCWYFDLDAVCKYRLFLDDAAQGTSYTDMQQRFLAARDKAGITQGRYVGKRKYKPMFR